MGARPGDAARGGGDAGRGSEDEGCRARAGGPRGRGTGGVFRGGVDGVGGRAGAGGGGGGLMAYGHGRGGFGAAGCVRVEFFDAEGVFVHPGGGGGAAGGEAGGRSLFDVVGGEGVRAAETAFLALGFAEGHSGAAGGGVFELGSGAFVG